MGIKAAHEAGIKIIKFNPYSHKYYSDFKLEKIECSSYNEMYEAISKQFS